MLDADKFAAEVKEHNVKNIAFVTVYKILFSDEVRKYCEMNSCGHYGKNWACPPGVGPVTELKARAHNYTHGIVLQTVHKLSGSFDLKGMMSGKKEHDGILRNVLHMFMKDYEISDALLLGAGHCEVCKECTYTSGEPCRLPDKKMESLEACGIDVMKLAKDCGISYNHGPSTVAYIGLILYNTFG
jgi:predicted metal-binding protein